MQFTVGNLYHIYNRGNNQQPIFFNRENYLFFLKKVTIYLKPTTDILAWTLMPNHFHFLIHANEKTVSTVKQTPIIINAATEAIRMLLSSYTKALQKQRGFTGSLFQQKTKCKLVADSTTDYGLTTFHYIHQNAFKAGLCGKPEQWEFSSLPDYASLRNGTLCNFLLAEQMLNINKALVLKETNTFISDEKIKPIF